jgi:hypothetical protein
MEELVRRVTATMTVLALAVLGLAPALASERGAAEAPAPGPATRPALRADWKDNILTIAGDHLPGGHVRVLYIEAYCRPGSTRREWGKTVIGHKTRLVSRDDDGRGLALECALTDGVVVRHAIRAGDAGDEVDFRITATNSTSKPSEAHWAQPCVQLHAFTGRDKHTYLDKCFIFLDGKLARMPTRDWAKEALYTPGQVWCPKHVDRNDVNPRPLSGNVPDNGLIGCFSADEKTVLAIAFEPYQELFQGVICCLHSDFRLGGLKPGETKKVRGKIYVVPADEKKLVERYRRDFPEHAQSSVRGRSGD